MDAKRQGYVKPDYGLDKERERKLTHVATRKMVQLENVDPNSPLSVRIGVETPRLSKLEKECFGQKPIQIIGETSCCETIYFLVKLEDKTYAVLLPFDEVKNKYPKLLENYVK
uniref:Uncharacterized protein n=4 Tax=Meloidogyne TaxID=189290 RepID=A0A915M175_MELJA